MLKLLKNMRRKEVLMVLLCTATSTVHLSLIHISEPTRRS